MIDGEGGGREGESREGGEKVNERGRGGGGVEKKASDRLNTTVFNQVLPALLVCCFHPKSSPALTIGANVIAERARCHFTLSNYVIQSCFLALGTET